MVRELTPWKLEMLQGKDFVFFRELLLPLPHPHPLPPVAPRCNGILSVFVGS